MDTEARILWEDAVVQLKEKELGASTIAMLESCLPSALDDGTLTVATNMGFVKRTLEKQRDVIEGCLEQAAFQPIRLDIVVERKADDSIDTHSDLTKEEITSWQEDVSTKDIPPSITERIVSKVSQISTPTDTLARRNMNPLVEDISVNDSELTFDTFIEGEENRIALQAAKQVANGMSKNFNPLFIYGKSGLGKTHLLKAIYNYIYFNDPSRICVYKTSRDFLNDYVRALNDKNNGNNNALSALTGYYQDIDILIIDDFQWLTERDRTIDYFFDIFNYLKDHDKQIVIAADRQPNQLGSTKKKMDERITSRVGGGFPIAIQIPDYELKLTLIKTFYERQKEEGRREHSSLYSGSISPELLEFMAEKSGTNIRTIKTFCHKCLITATEREKLGYVLEKEDVHRLVKESFPSEQKIVTIEEIQHCVEADYGINHKDLIGSKRNKELMEPRHAAIWLSRNLTEYTLADIGEKFGGRSHATVKHSIEWVDKEGKGNRVFFDRIMRIKENVLE
jgi:chromosomal replication initiator protein